jgi:hypothetical protein
VGCRGERFLGGCGIINSNCMSFMPLPNSQVGGSIKLPSAPRPKLSQDRTDRRFEKLRSAIGSNFIKTGLKMSICRFGTKQTWSFALTQHEVVVS